jgi:hypothetical protein
MANIFAPVSALANGTLINGVANFYTSTKPTVRVDGSALVTGDTWYNSSTGVEGYWNGTYWLTTPILLSGAVVITPAGGSYSAAVVNFGRTRRSDLGNLTTQDIFIHSAGLDVTVSSSDISNYWQVGLVQGAGNGATNSSFRNVQSPQNHTYWEIFQNTLLLAGGYYQIYPNLAKVLAPSNLQCIVVALYSNIL